MLDEEVLGRTYGLAVPTSIGGIVVGSLVAGPLVSLLGLQRVHRRRPSETVGHGTQSMGGGGLRRETPVRPRRAPESGGDREMRGPVRRRAFSWGSGAAHAGRGRGRLDRGRLDGGGLVGPL